MSRPGWRVPIFSLSGLQARGPGGRGLTLPQRLSFSSRSSGAGGIRTLVPRLVRRAVFSEVVPVPPRRLSVFELEFPRRVRWAARRLPAATSGTTARELKLKVIGRAPSPRSGVICFGSRFRGAPLLFISYSYRSFSPRGGLGVAVTRPGSGWLVWCYSTWLFSSSCYRSPFGVAVCGGAL